MKQSGIFYRFYHKLKTQDPDITVEEAQVAFIDYYKIDWGIVSKYATLNPLLEKRVLKVIEDQVSGDRFLLFKNSNFEGRASPPTIRH